MTKISADFHYLWNGETSYIDRVSIKIPTTLTPTKPTKKEVIALLESEKAKYKPESEYATFTPCGCIIYYSVIGWNAGWCAMFYNNKETYLLAKDNFFFDEPTGKYYAGRKSFSM